MQYRKFGNLGFDISTLGFGCMRLPLEKLPDGTTDYSKIDEAEAIKMIRYAIDKGVNYFDTAYPYHGGASEIIVGKALKDGYREKVKLATKLPIWKAKKYEDFEDILDEQLSKLETDCIDFYLMHGLNKNSWNKVKSLNGLKFLDEAVKKGKIKYPSFSFHDELDVFKNIVDGYDWKMCQIQLNILDENYQAGVEGLKYAGKKGIPVVIMEPLKGGRLAKTVPDDIRAVWDKAATKRQPHDWAFRWVCNFPEVTVVLSGMSTMEQITDNINIFETALPNSMTEEELGLVREVQELYRSKTKVGCTACNYCMPCPSGVKIPDIFSVFNELAMYGDYDECGRRYANMISEEHDASKCVECGQCEEACPQNIEIIEKLKEADEALR
jgi:predicted aldo/keto reductase-like oxidoreductase